MLFKFFQTLDKMNGLPWSRAENTYGSHSRTLAEYLALPRTIDIVSRSVEENQQICHDLLIIYEFGIDQVLLDLALHPRRDPQQAYHFGNMTDIRASVGNAQKHLRQISNQRFDETRMQWVLNATYLSMDSDGDRQVRHFLTIFEILQGISSMKIFYDCLSIQRCLDAISLI